MSKNVSENLDDPETCRGIVLSLRTLILMNVPMSRSHLAEIAWAEDAGTKAMIESKRVET